MKRAMTFFLALLFLAPLARAQEVDDQSLANRVRSAIEKKEELQGADILVVSVHGYVMLAGQVLSADQKKEASIAAAFASKNIRRLINELVVVDEIDHSFDDSDRMIMDQIVKVIPGMSPETVPVIHDGVVHLLGQVTREEGNEVATAISKMQGVKNIRLSYEYIQ